MNDFNEKVCRVLYQTQRETNKLGSSKANHLSFSSTLDACANMQQQQPEYTHKHTHAAVYLAGALPCIPFSFSTLVSWPHSGPQSNEQKISSGVQHWGEMTLFFTIDCYYGSLSVYLPVADLFTAQFTAAIKPDRGRSCAVWTACCGGSRRHSVKHDYRGPAGLIIKSSDHEKSISSQEHLH